MKRTAVVGLAVLASVSASAIDLTKYSDLSFAEKYAFSTNRAALVNAELKFNTGPWYFYTLLNLQTSGRYDEAKDFVNKARRDNEAGTQQAWNDLQLRQMFCNWEAARNKPRDGGRTPDEFLVWDLKHPNLGNLAAPVYQRKVPLAPNTYPTALDPERISFGKFQASGGYSWNNCLEDRFSFLAYAPKAACAKGPSHFDTGRSCPSGAPGFFDAVVAYLKEPNNVFGGNPAFKSLTLDQLLKLQKIFAGDPKKDLGANPLFVKTVRERLSALPDEGEEDRLTVEKRVLDFVRTLPSSCRDDKLVTLRGFLTLAAERGDFSHRELLKELLDLSTDNFKTWWQKPGDAALESYYRRELGLVVEPDSWSRAGETLKLVCRYLAAWRRAGEDLSGWAKWIRRGVIDRVVAETDLLFGKDPATVKVSVFTDDEYRRLRDRVDLVWAKTNPRTFAADGDVTLAIDVKNVQKMRLAVYDLDAAEALEKLGDEVKDDIDLDGCVPTAERTLDYSRFPALVRHAERLELPELRKPGLYVVECSGAGRCSRAVVRKGALRVVRRTGAGGCVFTAFDEHGRVAKPASLRLGSTTFVSDENGEMAVPFAADPRTAGVKTVVVRSGRLAARHALRQDTEAYALSLGGVLPQEGVIAGSEATLLLRPSLAVSGAPASLKLLKGASLKLTLIDADQASTVMAVENFTLSDTAESVCRFAVPDRLRRVEAKLTVTVRNVSQGKDETLTANWSADFNGFLANQTVEQAFLRRGADGYRLELKGRNGEPLAARSVRLTVKHRCFKRTLDFDLQADAAGLVRLGELTDIERVSVAGAFQRSWQLAEDALALPTAVSSLEGETVELPGRGLLAGAWPHADDLAARLSLCSQNARGDVVADCTSAVSVSNGLVRIGGLSAGDYLLSYVAEGKTVRLTVVKPAGGAVEGGMVVGAHRGVTDNGEPATLHIADATIEQGCLTVRLAGANDAARVHVFTRRMTPDSSDGAAAFDGLADMARIAPEIVCWTWPDRPSSYISGRDLGDKLRYILDRRNQPHRPGNLLERPSLLLNPWSAKETVNAELTARDGEGWAPQAERSSSQYGGMAGSRSRRGGFGDAGFRPPSLCRDFLAEPARTWANLRPDKDGVVRLDLPKGFRDQEVVVVALDGSGVDRVTLRRPTAPLVCRDRRSNGGARTERFSRAYATVGDLYGLLSTLGGDAEPFADFAFVRTWGVLGEEAKRDLYDKYASHELDVFVFFKDRPFFDTVVRPYLANKRFKQFTDLWLLGADLTPFAEPGRLQDLNAFERCLLAQRLPALAPKIARDFAEACEANPVSPETADQLLNKALGVREPEPLCEIAPCAAAPMAEEEVEPPDEDFAQAEQVWSNQASDMKSAAFVGKMKSAERMKVMRASRSFEPMPSERRLAQDMKHRENRQLYRPPARTREWIETHHYRRPHADRVTFGANPFWRDYAAAVAAGKGVVLSTNVIHAAATFHEAFAALAVTDLPLAGAKGEGLVFHDRSPDDVRRQRQGLAVLTRYMDGERTVMDEFVVGRPYTMLTIVTNPTDQDRRVEVARQIPVGAMPLAGSRNCRISTIGADAYSVEKEIDCFYFPSVVTGGLLRVVAEPTKVDRTSWEWISQNGTPEETLALLKTANFHKEDVELVGWRMKDAAFREKALAILDARGIFNAGLWSTVLEGRYALCENTVRVRQLLACRNVQARLKDEIGPSFRCSLVEIDPEVTDVFEHKEYWPLVNARAHALGGTATIANEGLKREYRAFLDMLATKPTLTAKDRLLAAVYLLAQDRVDEAKAQVEAVKADDVETRLQLDYLNAYLAFSDCKPEEGRRIAARHLDEPVRRWRERFREVVAQADEIAGRVSPDALGEGADELVPSLSLAVQGDGEVLIMSENVRACHVKAYPTDVEMTFSKNPFGDASVKDAATLIRPVWQVRVADVSARRRKLSLPQELLKRNLIVEATDDEGRATASLTLLAGTLDVQVARERGRLRVRDAQGRPLAAAYVKVYARDAAGRTVKFHKAGYTDLRGLFDYASVSTDSEFKPAEFAVLVLHDDVGVKTLTVKSP